MSSHLQTPSEGRNILCGKEDMIVCSEKGESVECRLLSAFVYRCGKVIVCNCINCSS